MRHTLRRLRGPLLAGVVMTLTLAISAMMGGGTAQAGAMTMSTRTVWVQVLDSCQEATPGAFVALSGNGLFMVAGPGPGTKVVTVAHVHGKCPLQRGDCKRVPTGCVAFHVPIPAMGSKVYTLWISRATPGFQPCNGGPTCHEFATLTITSGGTVRATVTDRFSPTRVVVWPTSGAPYTGTLTNPIVLHESGRFIGLGGVGTGGGGTGGGGKGGGGGK